MIATYVDKQDEKKQVYVQDFNVRMPVDKDVKMMVLFKKVDDVSNYIMDKDEFKEIYKRK